MPYATIDNTLQMYYEFDDFTDPWRKAETIVLHHGIAKSSRLWYAWPPLLARDYRVVRPDARGMGKSTVPPADYQWSLSGFAHDMSNLLDVLGLERVHLVGETLGGPISLQFAYEYPQRVASLTLCGAVYTFAGQEEHFAQARKRVRDEGVEAYAKVGSIRRFGQYNDSPLAMWYGAEMGKTSRVTIAPLLEYLPTIDLSAILPLIKVPTLLLVGGDSVISPGSRVAEMRRMMPHAKVVTFPEAPNQIHAVMPEKCVAEIRKFMDEIKN